MKFDGRWMFGMMLALAMATTSVEAGLLDFFFGDDEEEEQREEAPTVDEAPEGAGLFLNDDEYNLGVKGFGCLQDLAGVENERGWGQNVMRGISRVMLAAYGEQGIGVICDAPLLARMRSQQAAARSKMGGTRNLRSTHDVVKSNNITQPDRRLDSCASFPASYAGAVNSVYDDFASRHLDSYLNNHDRTQRSSAVKTFSLQDQVATVRTAQNVFSRCTQFWSTINRFVAAPDIPGINQEAVSEAFQSFVCDLPSTYSDIAAMRLQRDQELINFHNELVNGAEVSAMYENTKTMMSQLCERDSRMATVMDEIAEIKDAVYRM